MSRSNRTVQRGKRLIGIASGLLVTAAVIGIAAPAGALTPAEVGAPEPSASASGRFGGPFDVDPYGQPQRQYAKQQGVSDDQTLRLLARIASRPSASWFGHLGTESVEAGVRQRVEHAAKRGTVAVLVAYNIPFRDCGLHAAGQLTTAAEYKQWIGSFVAGLGTRKALVVVEPDALARTTCLTRYQRLQRYALVRYAVQQIAAQGSWTYIDAGHSKWKSVRVISNRLRAAGVAQATGFALNVSNFRPDDELIAYGQRVSARLGGAHFVVDTSRNGIAPDDRSWCNPDGKGLGLAPTADTGVPDLDAYLWVKTPGGSDGPCNGGPAAGAWFQQYALGLAERAQLSD